VIRSAVCALLLSTMPVAAVTRWMGDRTERGFHDWGAALARDLPVPASFHPEHQPLPEPDAVTSEDALPFAAPAQKPGKHGKKGRRTPAEAPDLAVHIDEKRLVELSRHRSIPEGRPVPAQGTRPAGIALFGVGGYGVGLRDGDVLTAVEGRSVQAEGQVVAVVMVMLARHARRISGEFWRGERRGSIVVEVPLVKLPP
jgi:hypothetical protein